MNSIYACARLSASNVSSSRFILSRTVASRFGFGLLPAMLWLTPGEVLAATADTTEPDSADHTLNEVMYAALPSLRVNHEISKGIEVDVEIIDIEVIDFDTELETTELDASDSELTSPSEASTDAFEPLPQNESEPSEINILDLSALDNENAEEE